MSELLKFIENYLRERAANESRQVYHVEEKVEPELIVPAATTATTAVITQPPQVQKYYYVERAKPVKPVRTPHVYITTTTAAAAAAAAATVPYEYQDQPYIDDQSSQYVIIQPQPVVYQQPVYHQVPIIAPPVNKRRKAVRPIITNEYWLQHDEIVVEKDVEENYHTLQTYQIENDIHHQHKKTVVTTINRKHHHTSRFITKENNYHHYNTDYVYKVNDIHSNKVEHFKADGVVRKDYKQSVRVEPAECKTIVSETGHQNDLIN